MELSKAQWITPAARRALGADITRYTNADYAADESRRSTIGYIYTYAGGLIT
ncbi:hypothetical protein M433DRAFT_9913 [Acidomyces richmondensis BFW]|nr:hypothetical protein M433DRAFT_9913 [Acidomyces richmondensis BFW]